MTIPFRSNQISGSLTRLVDGTSYLVEGTNISITSGTTGQITIEAVGAAGDITSVVAGAGLEGGGTSGDVTLAINSNVATLTGSNTFVPSSDSTTVFQVTNAAESVTALNIDTANMLVGIGTSSPSKTLSVAGTVSASLGFSGSLTRLVDGTSYLTAGSNITIASESNGQVTISSAGGATAAGSDRQIQFNDGGSALGASANLVFDGGSSLRVTGSMQITSSLEAGAHALLKIDHQNASNILVVTGSGRVGMGLHDPTGSLHIRSIGKASLFIEADTDNTPESDTAYIRLSQDAAATRMIVGLNGNASVDPDGVYLANAMSNAGIVGPRTAGSPLQFVTSNRVKICVQDDGQVGVGDGFSESTRPTAILHVSGGNAAQGTAKFSPLIKCDFDDNENILFVTGSGRVGIGTDDPTRDLDVKDDTDATAVFGRAFVGFDGTRSDAAIFAHRDHVSSTAYALQQRHDGDTIVNAPAGRSVGLRINGNNAVTVAGGSNNNVGFGNLGTPTARVHITGSTSEKDLLRVDGDQEAQHHTLYVSSSGVVGIGTSEPSDKFTVFGDGSTDRVFFLSGSGGATSPNETGYTDVAFFVSGTQGSKSSATVKGTALFGGDLVTSGTFFTENSVVRKPFRHILESTGSIMSLNQSSTHFFSMDADAEMTPGYLNYAYELGVENGIYDGQEITIIYTGTLRPADNSQLISPNFWSAPSGGDFVNQVRVGFPGARASLVLAWATFDPAVINGKTLGLIDSSAAKYNFTGSSSTAIGSPTYSAVGKSVTFGVQSAGSLTDVAQGLYNGLALAQSNGAAFSTVSYSTDGSGFDYVYQSALGTVGNTTVDGTLISAGAASANAGANAFTGGALPPNADNVNFYGADTAGNVYINNKSPALKMVWDASSSKWEVISSNNTSA